MTDSLQVRVVKTVQSVAPRRLTGSEVIDAFEKDARSDSVYATLSLLSKDGAGPLSRKRNDGGVLDYGITAGFDLDGWFATRREAKVPRSKHTPDSPDASAGDEAAQIISILRRIPKRLTSNDIESQGAFSDRRVMVLALAKLCEADGPLERERSGNGAPFHYGIKRDFDVEAWLAERGGSLDAWQLQTEPAAAAKPQPLSIVRHEAKPESLKADTAAPKEPEAARPGTGAAEAGSRDHISQSGKTVEQGVEPAPSVKDTRLAAPSSAAVLAPVAISKARAKPDVADPAAELVMVAASILAAIVRDHVQGIDACPELARALTNFELAERIHGKAKSERKAAEVAA